MKKNDTGPAITGHTFEIEPDGSWLCSCGCRALVGQRIGYGWLLAGPAEHPREQEKR